ncbi:MAG: hypothetical protein ACOC10_04965 [Bacteroidota bacterium]
MIKSYLILTLGLFFSVKVFATNYYLSNNGNDTNSGINPSNGWKTINRLNQVELKAGDSIFFHAGHSFPRFGITGKFHGTCSYI